MRWREGDQLTSETAEDVRDRLARISLNTKNTASEYINDFLEHQKHLEELDEAYTTSKTISIFLDQITDPDYVPTVSYCQGDRLPIEECIERIRAKERRLSRERYHKKSSSIKLRRTTGYEQVQPNLVTEIDLSVYITERGFYLVPLDAFKGLPQGDMDHVKSLNKKLRKKREDADLSGKRAKQTPSIRNRRLA